MFIIMNLLNIIDIRSNQGLVDHVLGPDVLVVVVLLLKIEQMCI